MDSLTQLTLGAAVGEAVLGRRVGGRAALWGAVCGTLPDLDVLVPLGNDVATFTYHRSASHSIFVLAALTPLVAAGIRRLHRIAPAERRGWIALVFAVFATHVLLDCFTAYGTQVLWPFVTTPVAWSTVFIIDPLVTVPLALGVLAALLLRRRGPLGPRLNAGGLAFATLYVAWSVIAKLEAQDVAERAVARQGIPADRVLAQAAPFNTVLWRIVAMTDDAYYEGFYSLLDDDERVRFRRHETRPELLEGFEDHWPVRRLRWFTHGFAAVGLRGDDIVITDLRLGIEPTYIFEFRVAELGNPHALPVEPEKLPSRYRLEGFGWLARRIFDESAGFPFDGERPE